MTSFRMPAIPNVHGMPGSTLEANNSYGERDIGRGAFFEQVTARVLAGWLASRPDRNGIHVFHSLGGFGAVSGARLSAIDAGQKWDLDHLVLTGGKWIMLNSKGIGNGTLAVIGPPPKGVLVKNDGTTKPQPWMDTNTSYTMAGIIYRLTGGMKG